MVGGLDVTSLADAVDRSRSSSASWKAVTGLLADQGLRRTALHLDLPLSASNPFAGCAGSHRFGHVWDKRYDARLQSYSGNIRDAEELDLRHIRPTMKFLSLFRTPLFIDHRSVMEQREATAFKPLCEHLMEQYGQYQALALPVQDPPSGRMSMLSAWGDEAGNDFGEFVKSNMQTLHMAAHYIRGLMRVKWLDHGTECERPDLSDRERGVLRLLADGYQVSGISDELAISERSVREYLARARSKLGTRTRTETVAHALIRGII